MTLLGNERSLLRTALQAVRALVQQPKRSSNAAAGRVAVLGHRGAPRQLAENTVLGCQRAIEQGADGVEVDVCVTRDGKVVLWHDRDPDPATMLLRRGAEEGAFVPRVPSDARGPLTELDSAKLDEFGLERPADGTFVGIDRLDQLIAWAAREARADWLMLDIKLAAEEVAFVPKLLTRLSELLLLYPAAGSRKLRLLTPIREIYEALVIGSKAHASLNACSITADFELGGVVEVAREIGARHVAVGLTPTRPWPLVREEVAAAIDARLAGSLESVTLWTLNEADRLREAAALGVDAILTDDVPGARRAVGGI